MKKKFLIISIVLVVILIAGGAWFKIRYDRMVSVFSGVQVEDIDLGRFEDGVYAGHFSEFLVSVDLQVIIEDQRIIRIEITEQNGGKGYEAIQTIDRIIELQTPKVDVVTGATSSSMCIMIAVQNALTDHTQD